MNNLQIFKNEEFGSIRTLTINDEPYFVGKDVAERLGYSNPQKAIRDHVDDEDKLGERIVLSGQNRKAVIINESGLYSLILSSKLPQAKSFKRWVTSEVLPSIRNSGTYSLPKNYKEALKQLVAQVEINEELELQNSQKDQIIGELTPKANYVDVILERKGLVTITQIAKDYGMSGFEMNKLLHDLGVQYKQSNQWLLYSKYQSEGYTQSVTKKIDNGFIPKVVLTTKWTQKGRFFIYELLKKNNILPIIENEKGENNEKTNKIH